MHEIQPTKRRRGRPPGSKNKTKQKPAVPTTSTSKIVKTKVEKTPVKKRRKKGPSPVVSVHPISEENEHTIKSVVAAFREPEKKGKAKKEKVKKGKELVKEEDKITFTKIPETNVYAKRKQKRDPIYDQNQNMLWDGKPTSIKVASFSYKELLDRYLKGLKDRCGKDWKITTRRIKQTS